MIATAFVDALSERRSVFEKSTRKVLFADVSSTYEDILCAISKDS